MLSEIVILRDNQQLLCQRSKSQADIQNEKGYLNFLITFNL